MEICLRLRGAVSRRHSAVTREFRGYTWRTVRRQRPPRRRVGRRTALCTVRRLNSQIAVRTEGFGLRGTTISPPVCYPCAKFGTRSFANDVLQTTLAGNSISNALSKMYFLLPVVLDPVACARNQLLLEDGSQGRSDGRYRFLDLHHAPLGAFARAGQMSDLRHGSGSSNEERSGTGFPAQGRAEPIRRPNRASTAIRRDV